MPGGYIAIDNATVQSGTSFTMPNTDNVASHELGTGIQADPTTGDFSYGSPPGGNLIDQWQSYPHATGNSATTSTATNPPSPPPVGLWDSSNNYTGLYDNTGTPMQASQSGPTAAELNNAAKIPYVSNPGSSNPATSVTCTDNNTSAPNGVPICTQLATGNGNGLDPFDKAYHPNTSLTSTSMQISGATAAELTQCETISLYGYLPHGGGPAMAFNYAYGPTGVRCYPSGIPSDTNQYAWQGPPSGGGFNMMPDADGAGAGVTVTDQDSHRCPTPRAMVSHAPSLPTLKVATVKAIVK
jgi:hypothetical protein